MVLVPTLLLGGAFPMALRLMVGVRDVGLDVGAVVAAKHRRGILGTLAVGFWMIPALGLVKTLALLTIGAAAVGLIATLIGSRVQRGMKWAIGAVVAAIVGVSLFTPANKLAELLLATRGGGALVFYEEGRGATGGGGTAAIRRTMCSEAVYSGRVELGGRDAFDAVYRGYKRCCL